VASRSAPPPSWRSRSRGSQLFEALADLGVIPQSAGKTLKVLVVDDDPKAVELIARRVERFAATVLRAYGGRQRSISPGRNSRT